MIKSATKKVAHIMMGLPGCGKSTQVDKLIGDIPGLQVIGYDSIRAALGVHGHDSKSFNPSIEPTVRYIVAHMKLAHVAAGLPIVLDDTHTHPENLEQQMDFFCSSGYDVHVWYFNVSAAVCAKSRPLIGKHVYERMMRQLVEARETLNEYARLKLVTAHCIER